MIHDHGKYRGQEVRGGIIVFKGREICCLPALVRLPAGGEAGNRQVCCGFSTCPQCPCPAHRIKVGLEKREGTRSLLASRPGFWLLCWVWTLFQGLNLYTSLLVCVLSSLQVSEVWEASLVAQAPCLLAAGLCPAHTGWSGFPPHRAARGLSGFGE